MWFDNCKADLIELGFTKTNKDGTVNLRKDKMHDIINLDETCISLGGSNVNRGGRPATVFFGPRFSSPQKAMSKTSLTTTMIAGSTAAGEALPPHLQFQTKAQSGSHQKLRNDMAEWLPDIRGKFGCDDEKS